MWKGPEYVSCLRLSFHRTYPIRKRRVESHHIRKVVLTRHKSVFTEVKKKQHKFGQNQIYKKEVKYLKGLT